MESIFSIYHIPAQQIIVEKLEYFSLISSTVLFILYSSVKSVSKCIDGIFGLFLDKEMTSNHFSIKVLDNSNQSQLLHHVIITLFIRKF